MHRRGVWNDETASQKIEHLGLMFGALAADPCGPVRGCGVPVQQRPWRCSHFRQSGTGTCSGGSNGAASSLRGS
jgi:hypothetical protein